MTAAHRSPRRALTIGAITLAYLVAGVALLGGTLNSTPVQSAAAPLSAPLPSYEGAEAMAAINLARSANGLTPLRFVPALENAAAAHSRYLALNGYAMTHTEVVGASGFSGVNPSDRAAAAGYGRGVGEVIAPGHTGRAAVDALLATVYHRHVLLSPDAAEMGYGGSGHSVIDLGYSWSGSAAAVVRFPLPGATEVPLSWAGNETPNPVEGLRGPFGYPITLAWANASAAVTLDRVSLQGPAGEVVTKNENWGGRALSAVPLAPLAPSTPYQISFFFTRSGQAARESWSFTTEASAPGAPRESWVERGDFGRIVHWSPPAGAAPAYYQIIKCSGSCTNPDTTAVNADQLYWVDPTPSEATYLFLSAVRGAERTTITLFLAAAPASRGYVSSKWTGQSAYPTLAPGEIADLWFAFRNSGTRAWVRGRWGEEANLGLSGDNKAPYQLHMDVNWLWDDRVATTTTDVVAPGEVGVFRFQLRAPQTPGVYRFSIRPVVDGVSWMQDEGVFLTVTVR